MFLSFLTLLLNHAWIFLCHISGRRESLFPRPLTAREEAAACQRLAAGDESARRELVEHNLRLVAHIAKKYRFGSLEQDDLVSIGSIGLMKAVSTFKPESGRLVTYAARCIENEMLMALRATKKHQQDISLSQPIGTDSEGNEMLLMDMLGTEPGAVMDQAAASIDFSRAMELMERLLTERERLVIALRYGLMDGQAHPQHEVADRIGLSRSYVSRIEKGALAKLRRARQKGG